MTFDELRIFLIARAENFKFVFLPNDAKQFAELSATIKDGLIEENKKNIRDSFVKNAKGFTRKDFAKKRPNVNIDNLPQDLIDGMTAVQDNEMLRRLFDKTNTERLRLECRVLCTGAGMSEHDFIEYFNYYLHATGNKELTEYI